MSRILNEKEKAIYIENRNELHEQLTELQADLEDMTNLKDMTYEELIECHGALLGRVNWCLRLILETDEDNI